MNTFDMSLNIQPAAPRPSKPAASKDSAGTQESDFRKALEQTTQGSGQDAPAQGAQEPETTTPGETQTPAAGETDKTVTVTDAAAMLAAMLLPIVPVPQAEAAQPQQGVTLAAVPETGMSALTGVSLPEAAIQPVAGQAQTMQTGAQPQAQTQTGETVQTAPAIQTDAPAQQAVQTTAPAQTAAPQAAQDAPQAARPQEQTPQEADVSVTGRTAAQPEQRLFDTVESTPIQVGDPVRADDPVLAERLSSRIVQAAANGQDTITVQLAPRELGQITIRLSSGAEGTLISLHSENAKTLSLLSEHAANIGALVERSQPGAVTVTVEREQPGQQQQEQYAQQQRQGGGQQQERNNRRPAHPGNDDFVQQLRLGLAAF